MEKQRPAKLNKALMIIWICFVITILQVLWDFPKMLKESPSSGASIFVSFLIFTAIGFQALLIWLIGRGKNWARWVFLIWSVVSIAMSLKDLPTQIVTYPALLFFSAVVTVISLFGLAMLFQTGADEYFRKPVVTPPQDPV